MSVNGGEKKLDTPNKLENYPKKYLYNKIEDKISRLEENWQHHLLVNRECDCSNWKNIRENDSERPRVRSRY